MWFLVFGLFIVSLVAMWYLFEILPPVIEPEKNLIHKK